MSTRSSRGGPTPRSASQAGSRDATATPRHLGFALGIHYCMGAALARLEGEIFFVELARRVQVLELTREPVYRPNLLIRGLCELPLRLA